MLNWGATGLKSTWDLRKLCESLHFLFSCVIEHNSMTVNFTNWSKLSQNYLTTKLTDGSREGDRIAFAWWKCKCSGLILIGINYTCAFSWNWKWKYLSWKKLRSLKVPSTMGTKPLLIFQDSDRQQPIFKLLPALSSFAALEECVSHMIRIISQHYYTSLLRAWHWNTIVSNELMIPSVCFKPNHVRFYTKRTSLTSVLQFLQSLSKNGAAVKPSQPWPQSWFRPCVSGSGPAPTCGGCGWVVPVRTAPGEPGPSWPAYALTAQPSSTQHRSHSICCSCVACSGMTVRYTTA